MKWKGSKRQSTASFVKNKQVQDSVSGNLEDFQPIGCIECRGLEIENCHISDGLKVISTSGAVFDEVDVSQGDWFDFDEALGQSVGISKIETKVVKI